MDPMSPSKTLSAWGISDQFFDYGVDFFINNVHSRMMRVGGSALRAKQTATELGIFL